MKKETAFEAHKLIVLIKNMNDVQSSIDGIPEYIEIKGFTGNKLPIICKIEDPSILMFLHDKLNSCISEEIKHLHIKLNNLNDDTVEEL